MPRARSFQAAIPQRPSRRTIATSRSAASPNSCTALPEDWKPLVEKAGDGMTTGTRVTEKGVEYLAICKKRQVNDDAAAEIVFRAEDLGKKKSEGEDPNSAKYLEELRSKAQIVNK